MIKKIATVLILLISALPAMCQDRYQSPQTIAYDAPAEIPDGYEISVQLWNESVDMVAVADTTELMQLIDLEALGLYGIYRALVRAYNEEMTPWGLEREYSDYISSSIVGDAATPFYIERKKPVGKPGNVRVE